MFLQIKVGFICFMKPTKNLGYHREKLNIATLKNISTDQSQSKQPDALQTTPCKHNNKCRNEDYRNSHIVGE